MPGVAGAADAGAVGGTGAVVLGVRPGGFVAPGAGEGRAGDQAGHEDHGEEAQHGRGEVVERARRTVAQVGDEQPGAEGLSPAHIRSIWAVSMGNPLLRTEEMTNACTRPAPPDQERASAEELVSALTPREREILSLVGN